MSPDDDPNCVFCRLVRSKELEHRHEAAWVIDQGPVLAFLDKNPLFEGHVLVVPRDHYRNIFELPGNEVAGLFETSQRMAKAVKAAMESDGIFMASNNGVSQSVDHLHIHVVPRNKKDGLRGFMWPRKKYESEEYAQEIAARIRTALAEFS